MPTWNSLSNNQLVDRTALADAVATGVFIERPGQTVPTGQLCVQVTEAVTWLFLDNASMPSSGRLPMKQEFIGNATVPFHWIENSGTSYCETYIIEQTVFTGFASPLQGFVSGNDMFYADASLNSVIYFNPTTITGGTDAISIPITGSTSNTRPTGAYYHAPTNRLYVQAFYNGGVSVIDCSTKAVIGLIPYGTNGSFSRGNVYFIPDLNEIWGFGNTGYVRFDATTQTVNPSTAVNPSGAVYITSSNGKLYIFKDQSSNSVEIYTIAGTSLTYLTTINGLCQNVSNSGNYVSRGYYTDAPNNKIYLGEISTTGGIIVVDTITDTISRVPIDKEGFTYASPGVIAFHPLRNSVYIGGSIFTTGSSDSEARLWNFDVATQTIIQTISPSVNVGINSIIYYPPNNSVYVGSAGLLPESVPNTGHASDGVIIKFN